LGQKARKGAKKLKNYPAKAQRREEKMKENEKGGKPQINADF